ncbi:PaaX family transcriptional regulator [Mesorhizobium sp. NBSH29]|uniref:PaaX family transcriptional regulator n=1 Tax=Mesorhizobium sp. NBSH29 TaxID=2654249 RepID=UPI0021563CE3|nr:PaaX family transcriptional regulator C-terminal domain-containing protein [Mesorhizobium sp. NBSH29]
MTQSPTLALSRLTQRLHERGRLRVWSLVITIFGDAIVPRGGQVPLATLQEITGHMGIEPGALRTAMSRLAADRWVRREKEGRNSLYALDQHGRHAFDLATQRIYAASPPAWDGYWSVAITPPGQNLTAPQKAEMERLGFVECNTGTFLRPQSAQPSLSGSPLDTMLVMNSQTENLPKNVAAFWNLEETAQAYAGFNASMKPFHDALQHAPLLGLDALTARILLIHDWRRIVLHDPGLPEALLPNNWPGQQARQITRAIYANLSVASEHWINNAGLPALQSPQKFNARFGGIA